MSLPFRAHCNRKMFHPKSGRVLVIRVLGVLASTAAGVCVFDAMLGMFTGRWPLVAFLSLMFGFGAWQLQEAVIGLVRRRPNQAAIRGLAIIVLSALLCAFGHSVSFGLMNLLAQILLGAMAIFGGRRSEEGLDVLAQLLGYRRTLSSQSPKEIAARMESDSQYFYQMLPYAEAFGIGRSFVKHSSRLKLEPCMWVHGWKELPTDPAQFYELYLALVEKLRQEDGPGFWGNRMRTHSGRRRRAKAKRAGRHAAPRKTHSNRNEPEKNSHVRAHRTGGSKAPTPAGHVRPHRRSYDDFNTDQDDLF